MDENEKKMDVNELIEKGKKSGLPDSDFEDARVAAYRIHKAVGFRETGTLDRIIHLELTREDYLKGISVCCDK